MALVGTGWRQAVDKSSEEDCTYSVEVGKPKTVIYRGPDSEVVVGHQDTADVAGDRVPLRRLGEAHEVVQDPEAQGKDAAWVVGIVGRTVGVALDIRRRVASAPGNTRLVRLSSP